jgi:Tfp pilus assembly protein PilO
MQPLKKYWRLYKELIISICMILVSILGVIFGIIPATQKVIAVRENSVNLTKSIQVLRTKINILESKDESTYRDEFTQLLEAVPGDKSLPTVFTTLDGLCQQSGVTLLEFSLAKLGSIASNSGTGRPSAEEQKIGSNLLPFTVTVSGNYTQIYAFLTLVNNVRRFFRVNNFEISFADITGITIHVGMDAFYAPVSTALGLADAPLVPLSQREEDVITRISQMPYLGYSAATSLPSAQPSESSFRSTLFAP